MAKRQVNEDEPGFNPQTMGNKKYKEKSPAIERTKAHGEYGRPEVPHGSTSGRPGKFDVATIQRKIHKPGRHENKIPPSKQKGYYAESGQSEANYDALGNLRPLTKKGPRPPMASWKRKQTMKKQQIDKISNMPKEAIARRMARRER